jgi:hypothetical protein
LAQLTASILFSLTSFTIIQTEVYAAQVNWCTKSPDSWRIFAKRVPGRKINVAEACRKHDLCYWTISASKENCDSSFHADLRNKCFQKFSITAEKSALEQCLKYSKVYYKAVSTTGFANNSFRDAQSESKEVSKRLSDKFFCLEVSRYYSDIAWQLAGRQAKGEGIAQSIENATNAITAKIGNPCEERGRTGERGTIVK